MKSEIERSTEVEKIEHFIEAIEAAICELRREVLTGSGNTRIYMSKITSRVLWSYNNSMITPQINKWAARYLFGILVTVDNELRYLEAKVKMQIN